MGIEHLLPLRCRICPRTSCRVPGSGPRGARLFCIGEAPGADERNMPFVGRAGREFNEHYLPLAGADRETAYVTNTRKCRPPANRKPTDEEIAVCGQDFLVTELRAIQPQIVVLMGGTACKLVQPELNDGLEIDLETHHGYPLHNVVLYQELPPFTVFPTYHPALGLHSTDRIRDLRTDFGNLGAYLRGMLTVPVDRYAGKEDYTLVASDGYLDQAKVLTLDTERVAGRMWSVQLGRGPGSGRMALTTDHEAMQTVQAALDEAEVIWIHNDQHDVEECWRAGLYVDWSKVKDTMQHAFRLGLPQGLKPLAYRLCGMKMQSYMDVVRGPSLRSVVEWCGKAAEVLPIVEKRKQLKTKVRVEYKHHPFINVVNRLLRSIENNSKSDPWKSMKNHEQGHTEEEDLEVQGRELVYAAVGRMPEAGLDKVEFGKALWYGCRDADATWRAVQVLERIARGFGRIGRAGEWEGRLLDQDRSKATGTVRLAENCDWR